MIKVEQFEANSKKLPSNDPQALCKLDSYYQMLAIIYMLLTYCQAIVYFILICVVISNMKRFFLLTDEQPFRDQKANGVRKHVLFKRTLIEYSMSFDFALLFMRGGGRVSRNGEIRHLLAYKSRFRNERVRKSLKAVDYEKDEQNNQPNAFEYPGADPWALNVSDTELPDMGL